MLYSHSRRASTGRPPEPRRAFSAGLLWFEEPGLYQREYRSMMSKLQLTERNEQSIAKRTLIGPLRVLLDHVVVKDLCAI